MAQDANISCFCARSCHQSIVIPSMNKGDTEKAALALEQEYMQNGSSFQVIPALLESYMNLASATEKARSQLAQDETWKASLSSDSSSPVVVEDGLLEKVSIVKCTSCDKSVALLISGNFHSLHYLLKDETKADGWAKVESERDRLVLFILNQIIYREYEVPDEDELQVEYALPDKSDFTKILWNNGVSVGFYSVKPKGSLNQESMDWYRMTVLDTIFIRSSERRKGYALNAIRDILKEFPDQNIGFSTPISLPMIRVLKKHLQLHPEDRMKLWEIDGCGLEGNCQILWYLFKRR